MSPRQASAILDEIVKAARAGVGEESAEDVGLFTIEVLDKYLGDDVAAPPLDEEGWDESLLWDFLWMAVATARAPAKDIPTKPRRRLSRLELLELKRTLEHVAHGANSSLEYLERYLKQMPEGS